MTQGIQTMTMQDAKTVLMNAEAKLHQNNGTSQTYVSTKLNKTFIIFGVRPGVVKMQVMSGCTC